MAYNEREREKSLSHVQLFATLWTVAYYAPPSMGFSRQGYWSVSPFPSPEDLPDPGIKHTAPEAPVLQADSLPLSYHLPHPMKLKDTYSLEGKL